MFKISIPSVLTMALLAVGAPVSCKEGPRGSELLHSDTPQKGVENAADQGLGKYGGISYEDAVDIANELGITESYPSLYTYLEKSTGGDLLIIQETSGSRNTYKTITPDSLRFTDRHGDQAVVFSRLATHVEDPVDGTVSDRIVLSAAVYSLPATRAPTAAGWQHADDIECDGVDIEAGFYPDRVSVTDLDGNGTAELTFAYHRFCGGGIDPRDVTVVLREGGNSYVLEGQTLVRVGDDPPFGGGFQMDAALGAAPQWVQDKVLTTFQQLRDEPVAESDR